MTVTGTSATTVAIGSVPAMGAEIVIATASAETGAETEESDESAH